MNLELYEIPTEEEIEFEVSNSMPKDAVSAKSKSDAIFFQVEEVRVRLPWNNATLAGKWWGSKTIRPIGI